MANNQTTPLPAVSVIAPAYNDQANIAKLIDSLLAQDYPAECLEIIIVDNNSHDATGDIVKRYPVKLLQEQNIQSSYAARNKGIRNAKNEILAFIDSDCIASAQWLKEGVKILLSESADMVGGKIEFFYPAQKTVSRIYDALTDLQTEITIKEKGAAPTANLFVKSSVFQQVGLFPNSIKSGADFIWTAGATQRGFSLVYSENAVVKHPTRPFKALLKKRFRLGTGSFHLQISRGKAPWKIALHSIFTILLPVPPWFIKKVIQRSTQPNLNRMFINLWCIAYLCKVARRLGTLTELFNTAIRKNQK